MNHSPAFTLSNTDHDAGRLFFPAILCAAVACVFWRCIFFDFVNYDDLALTTGNTLTKSLAPYNLMRIFSFFSLESYYPVRLLSIAVDRAMWGDNPAGYHLTNVVIHLLNVLMLYFLAARLVRDRGWASRPARMLAFATALFFGVHPAVSGVVAWVPGREELLMLFFCLACLHLHIQADKREAKLLLRVAEAYACAFSCLSNVLGAMTPALVTMYILVLDEKGSLKKALRTTWFLWIIGALAVFLKGLALLAWDDSSRTMLFPHVPSAIRYLGDILDAPNISYLPSVPLPEKIRAVLSVYWGNFAHLFLPLRMPVMYSDRAPGSFADPQVLGGLAAMAATGWAAVRARKNRLMLFGILWFLIGLFPSSQVFQHHIARADRLLYLPLPGFALVLSLAVFPFGMKAKSRRPLWLFMAFILVLAFRTAMHLPVWANGITLYEHAIQADPDYYQTHFYYAQELKRLGLNQKAIEEHEKAIALRPDAEHIWHPYYEHLVNMGLLDKAESAARKIVKQFPDSAWAHNNLAIILDKRGKGVESLEQFETAVKLAPRSAIIRENLADAYSRNNQPEKAAYYLKEALKVNPRAAGIHLRLANELERVGDIPGAVLHYREAKKYDPTFAGVDFRVEYLTHGGGRGSPVSTETKGDGP